MQEAFKAQDKILSDEIQVIFLANAPSKARLCAVLLEELGCERVEYYIRKSVPSGFFVFFSPSKKVKKVIQDAKVLQDHIEAISTDHIDFTPDGPIFIWKEPQRPSLKR